MRQTTTASLAAAVGLALAASAGAQTPSSGAPAGRPSIGINATAVSTAPRIAGPATPAPAGNTNTTNNAPPTTTTQTFSNVDVRGQQTTAATAGIHASGSTSALGTLAPGQPNTSGVTVTGLGVLGNGGSVSGAPFFMNPSDVTEGLPATTVAAAGTNGVVASDVFAGTVTTADAQVAAANGASVNRAINQVSRDRKRVGRDGQQLYSIAPRTNADRSHEMPDDPLPPSLTGSNSTLTR